MNTNSKEMREQMPSRFLMSSVLFRSMKIADSVISSDIFDDIEKEILTLRFMDNLTDAQIGKETGYSRVTINTKINACLDRLAQVLSIALNDPDIQIDI